MKEDEKEKTQEEDDDSNWAKRVIINSFFVDLRGCKENRKCILIFFLYGINLPANWRV